MGQEAGYTLDSLPVYHRAKSCYTLSALRKNPPRLIPDFSEGNLLCNAGLDVAKQEKEETKIVGSSNSQEKAVAGTF